MNFAFIIDTSLSMLQYFDNNQSYFDSAKKAIKEFVLNRIKSQSDNNAAKKDKYFLVTLNENLADSLVCNWSACTEHFLGQLEKLEMTYDFTDVNFAVRNSFNMLNFINHIDSTKHVYGRLFSQIKNSYVILLTDGNNFSSEKEIVKSPISLSNNESGIFQEEQNMQFNFTKLYKEIYRWDQNIVVVVMSRSGRFKEEKLLTKLTKSIGGTLSTVTSCVKLTSLFSDLASTLFSKPRASIKFYVTEKKHSICSITKGTKSCEKWPFPDEILLNKNNQDLPTKRAFPCYEINDVKFEITGRLLEKYWDDYLVNDGAFCMDVLKWNEKLSAMRLSEFLINYKECVYFDLFVKDFKKLKEIEYCSFGILAVKIDGKMLGKMMDYLKLDGNKDKVISEYFDEKNDDGDKRFFNASLFLLPYNYSEFIQLTTHYKQGKINNQILSKKLEVYYKKIPFYYRITCNDFLSKEKIINFDVNKTKEHIKNTYFNQNIISEIKLLTKFDYDQILDINKSIFQNSKEHKSKTALCCYEPQENYNKSGALDTLKEYNDFITKAFSLNSIGSNNEKDAVNIHPLKHQHVILPINLKNNITLNVSKNISATLNVNEIGDGFKRPEDIKKVKKGGKLIGNKRNKGTVVNKPPSTTSKPSLIQRIISEYSKELSFSIEEEGHFLFKTDISLTTDQLINWKTKKILTENLEKVLAIFSGEKRIKEFVFWLKREKNVDELFIKKIIEYFKGRKNMWLVEDKLMLEN